MRRSGAALLAVFLCIGTVVAWTDDGADARTAPGTVDCSKVTGVLTFEPPLTGNGTQGKVAGRFTLSGCKAQGASIPPRATASATATVESSCNGIVPPIAFLGLSIDATIWWGIRTLAPSKVSFVGEHVTVTPTVSFVVGGQGTTSTGSFRGTDSGASSTTSIETSATAADVAAACGASPGLRSLKVTGGTVHIG